LIALRYSYNVSDIKELKKATFSVTKAKNQNILDNPIFSWLIVFLILYSVICFSLETLPDLKESTIQFLWYSEIVVVVIFTIEYFLRIYYAENRIKFIFSFYGIIDLLAILPFYIAPALDLRTLRVVRLLRLARLLKLVRYNAAIVRFSKALYLAKEELIIFISATLILIYLAAVGIYYFEHQAQPEVFRSIFDSLWWAVASLTTVGYGDIYPITSGGKVFTFFILILGLGLVSIPAGIIASALSAVRRQQEAAGNVEAP